MKTPVSFAPTCAALGWKGINGYSPDGLRRKDAFLKDARRYLRSAADYVKPYGVNAWIKTNPAGIAVSGEVFGYFALPDAPELLFVEVSSTVVSPTLAAVRFGIPVSRRPTDGLVILMQERAWVNDARRLRAGRILCSRHLPVFWNSYRLAQEILARLHIETNAQPIPSQLSLF